MNSAVDVAGLVVHLFVTLSKYARQGVDASVQVNVDTAAASPEEGGTQR